MRHYYHVWAGGSWPVPVREHAQALGAAGFPGPVTVGLVGPPADRQAAREVIEIMFATSGAPVPDSWVEADEGYEEVTLSALHRDARAGPADYPVLYAHTKGARDDTAYNAMWRWSMTAHVVGGWRACAGLVSGDYDTAGCHWITPEQYHNPPDHPVLTPMYGGNFWWSRTSYLRRLPAPSQDYRHQAEEWIGLAAPRACDLLPGWPSLAFFQEMFR